MSSLEIRYGKWVYIKTEEEFKEQFKDFWGYARVQKGKWEGEGNYYVTSYSQPCPRGCCHDSVVEIQTAFDRAYDVKEAMRDLASELREAREKGA